MKILFLTDSLNRAGKEKQLFLLMQGLEYKQVSYKVVLRYPKVDFPLDKNKLQYVAPKGKLKQLRELRKIVKDYKPDIIHSWEGYMSAIGRVASLGMKVKFIDGSIRYARKFKWYSAPRLRTWLLNKLSNLIVANSKAGLLAVGFKENRKNRVIYNGIDQQKFSETIASKNKEFIIGMVANFTQPKDFKTIVDVGVKLLNEGVNVKFIFIGDGPEKRRIQEIVPDEFRDKFSFGGKVESPIQMIENINVGILLSKKGHSEGMSNSIMEYMSVKKPVIATNTGGNPELVEDKINGFLIPHEDHKLLYEKILFLIKNRETAKKMGEESFKKIVANHQIDDYLNNWISLYDELVG